MFHTNTEEIVAIGEIAILTSRELGNASFHGLAKRLHSISSSEPAILERSVEFYQSQLENDRLVVVMEDESIVGVVGLLPLSDKFAEISGAWIHADMRNNGMYQAMRKRLHEIAKNQGFTLVTTNKPGIPGNAGAVITNVKNRVYPVQFTVLAKLDRDAYVNCCSCDDEHNHDSCSKRDKTCFLLMQEAPVQEVRKILNSTEWKSEVPRSAQEKINSILGNTPLGKN